jgi:nicotinamidase/pyrazinamidase
VPNNVHLVIIDPQNDFCDPSGGTLYVPGADEDMNRLATMVKRFGATLTRIHVTLDSHPTIHVAHPIYWRDAAGHHPNPFTIITAQQVREGIWLPSRASWLHGTRNGFGALDYLEALESHGKYPLCIWPPHCRIGHWGHNVFPPLLDALDGWEESQFVSVDYLPKGSNSHTEHYSAIKADVMDPTDATTELNRSFLETLNEADQILFAGEAGSHCLASTIRDADAYFSDSTFIKKVVLLKDTTSPVPGFESLQDDFVQDMCNKGMRIATSIDELE